MNKIKQLAAQETEWLETIQSATYGKKRGYLGRLPAGVKLAAQKAQSAWNKYYKSSSVSRSVVDRLFAAAGAADDVLIDAIIAERVTK